MRPVIHAHFEALPKDAAATFTRRDVMKEIHDVAVEVVDKQPFFFYPGCLMLIGGVILAFARRRAAHDSNAHI
jgi:hypothetical protein